MLDSHDMLKGSCPSSGSCTAILDSGSNIIAGPTIAMKAISEIANVKPDCSNFDSLPVIKLTLGDMPVAIPPSGYVMKVPMPNMPIGSMDQTGDEQGGDLGGAGEGMGDSGMGLIEREVSKAQARVKSHRRWKHVFESLYQARGVDLRDQIAQALDNDNRTAPQFMCMLAAVPLDKKTEYGSSLWIVGTPLMDAYYARWSYGKEAKSPKIYLQALENSTTCKEDATPAANDSQATATALMRKQKGAGSNAKAVKRPNRHGPTVRTPEEIAFPHWAKSLLHI